MLCLVGKAIAMIENLDESDENVVNFSKREQFSEGLASLARRY